MKKIFSWLLIFSLHTCFVSMASYAQSNGSIEEVITNVEENISEYNLEDCDNSEVEADIGYYNDRLDINTCTADDLRRLRFLNDFQIMNIINYVKEYGKLVSLYELQMINGLTPATIEKLMNFVTIEENRTMIYSFDDAFKYGKHELLLSCDRVLEKQSGYPGSGDTQLSSDYRYLGSPEKLYMKYRFNFKNKVQWGLTAEKDAGEEFFRGSNKAGFDFYSMHLFITDLKSVRKIVAGDFNASFGQGLILSSDWSSGKSSYIAQMGRGGSGLQKYSSSNENSFFRGGGTTISIGKIDFTGFFSQKKIDANLQQVYPSEANMQSTFVVTSFQTTGIHSTLADIRDEKTVKESIGAGNITVNGEIFRAGMTFIHNEYDKFIDPANSLYNKYDFRGMKNSALSFDYNIITRGIRIFGEEGGSYNKGYGLLNGLIMSPSSRVYVSVLHRFYSPDFQASHGRPFSVSGNSEEKGIFTGIQFNPVKGMTVSAYSDIYYFPWIKYTTSSPSSGYDYMVQTDYVIQSKLKLSFKYSHRLSETDNSTQEISVPTLMEKNIDRFRFGINTEINGGIKLGTRFEYMIYSPSVGAKENGFMIFQDIGWAPENTKISALMRYGLFDSDSYNTSVYVYEPDLLYSSTPGFYSKGARYFIMLKYVPVKRVDLRIRFSQTWYANKDVIGSGPQEIKGNTKTEVKILLKFQLSR